MLRLGHPRSYAPQNETQPAVYAKHEESDAARNS